MVGFGDFGASIGGPIGTIDDAVAGMTGASSVGGNVGFDDFGQSVSGSDGLGSFGLGSDGGISQAAVDFADAAYGGMNYDDGGAGFGSVEQIDDGLFAVMDDAGGFFADDQGNYLGEIGTDSGFFTDEPMAMGFEPGFDMGMAPQMAEPVSVADREEIAGYGGFGGLLGSEPMSSGMAQEYQSGINPAVMDAIGRGSQSASQLSDIMFGGQPVADMRGTMTGASDYDGMLSGSRMMDTPSLQGMPETGMGARGVQTSPAMGINIGDRELDALGRIQSRENPNYSATGAEAWAALNRAASPTSWWGNDPISVANAPYQFEPVSRAGGNVFNIARSPGTEVDLRAAFAGPNPVPGQTHFANAPLVLGDYAQSGRASRGTQGWVQRMAADPASPRVGQHTFGNPDRASVPQFTPVVTAGLDRFQPGAAPGAEFANLQGAVPGAPATMMASIPTPPSRPDSMMADRPAENVSYASFDMPDMNAPMQPVGFDSAFFSPEPMLDMGTGLDIGRSAMPVSEPAPIGDVGQALAALNQPAQAQFSMPGAGTSMQGMIGVPSETPDMAGLYDPEMMGMPPLGMQPRGGPVENTFNMNQAQSLQRGGPAQFNAFEEPMQASAPERGDRAQFNAFEEPMQFDPPSRPAPDLDAPRSVQTRTITAEPTPARDTEAMEIARAEPSEENINRAAQDIGIEPETEVAAVDPEKPEEEERTTFKDAVKRGLTVTAITGSPVLGLGAGLLSALFDSDMEWGPGTAPTLMGDGDDDPGDPNADLRRRIRELEEARRREAEEETARPRQRTGWNLPGRG